MGDDNFFEEATAAELHGPKTNERLTARVVPRRAIALDLKVRDLLMKD